MVDQPITGYRFFFPDAPREGFQTVDAAWDRRCKYQDTAGNHTYVHTLLGGVGLSFQCLVDAKRSAATPS